MAAPVVLLLALVLGLSACTATDRGTGTLSGTAEPCVGPEIPNAHYVVRFVRVTTNGRTVAMRTNLTRPYRFTFTLPAGTYRVTAPADGSIEVHVIRGQVARVALHNGCL